MSREGKDCPSCNTDIGVWVILKAPWPGKLVCKNCGAIVSYEKKGWPMLVSFTFIYLSLLVWVLFGENIITNSHFVVTILFAVLLWLPFETIMVYVLRNHHRLILKNS